MLGRGLETRCPFSTCSPRLLLHLAVSDLHPFIRNHDLVNKMFFSPSSKLIDPKEGVVGPPIYSWWIRSTSKNLRL